MQKRQEAGEAHVLDLGAGSGTLSVLAARAGADSVTAVEMLEPLCRIARGVRITGLYSAISGYLRAQYAIMPDLLHKLSIQLGEI